MLRPGSKARSAFAVPTLCLAAACGATLDRSALFPPTAESRDEPVSETASEVASAVAPPTDRSTLRSVIMPGDGAAACEDSEGHEPFVDCMLARVLGADPEALVLGTKIMREHHVLLGIEKAQVIADGDFRGRIVVEPAVPIGSDRHHLDKVLGVFEELDRTFGAFAEKATSPLAFVTKPRAVRFFETTKAKTPSAYIADSVIAYNVRGELWTSAESVIETFVHELFHISDAAHGRWSERALQTTYDAIRTQCQEDQQCLDRFAPHETKVDGGVFYAFHPTSDVREYAAELAARYFREQRRRLEPEIGALDTPFKCRAPENELAWRGLADEFFGGLDLVPGC